MTLTSTAKTTKDLLTPRMESALEKAGPKIDAAREYVAPKVDAARDLAVAKAAEAMERLTPQAEALRDRLVERASDATAEATKRGRLASAVLRGKPAPTRKRRTMLWMVIGVVGGLGAGLLARRRSADPAPAWTNLGDTAPEAGSETSANGASPAKVTPAAQPLG